MAEMLLHCTGDITLDTENHAGPQRGQDLGAFSMASPVYRSNARGNPAPNPLLLAMDIRLMPAPFQKDSEHLFHQPPNRGKHSPVSQLGLCHPLLLQGWLNSTALSHRDSLISHTGKSHTASLPSVGIQPLSSAYCLWER